MIKHKTTVNSINLPSSMFSFIISAAINTVKRLQLLFHKLFEAYVNLSVTLNANKHLGLVSIRHLNTI